MAFLWKAETFSNSAVAALGSTKYSSIIAAKDVEETNQTVKERPYKVQTSLFALQILYYEPQTFLDIPGSSIIQVRTCP